MRTIKQLREEAGLTQLALANRLDVTPTTVYNWERGKHMPTIIQLRALALAFGVKMEDIAIVGVDVDRAGEGKAAA